MYERAWDRNGLLYCSVENVISQQRLAQLKYRICPCHLGFASERNLERREREDGRHHYTHSTGVHSHMQQVPTKSKHLHITYHCFALILWYTVFICLFLLTVYLCSLFFPHDFSHRFSCMFLRSLCVFVSNFFCLFLKWI